MSLFQFAGLGYLVQTVVQLLPLEFKTFLICHIGCLCLLVVLALMADLQFYPDPLGLDVQSVSHQNNDSLSISLTLMTDGQIIFNTVNKDVSAIFGEKRVKITSKVSKISSYFLLILSEVVEHNIDILNGHRDFFEPSYWS